MNLAAKPWNATSALTGRQRVMRTLEFDRPDRVPRDLWLLPIAAMEHGQAAIDAFQRRWPGDFGGPNLANPALAALKQGDPFAVGQYHDEWGCVFENVHAGVIGEVKMPLLDDWSKLADLREPVEALNVDLEEVNRQCAASDRFMLAGACPRPFERAQFLRGSENLYMDLAEESSQAMELLRRIHAFYCKELESWARTRVDALSFIDDWGSQRSLLIAPQQWRRIFKPMYADYARIAHDAGKKVFMHSDGFIFDIYEDLIEIGVDAINSQLFCMDIPQIARRFAGRMTFWGEMDRQRLLPFGTPEEVRQAVALVVETLYRPEGGVIAQFEFGAGTKLPNAHAVFQAWEELTGGAVDAPR